MNDRPRLFAFLADRLASARIDIANEHHPVMFQGGRRGFMQDGNEARPFVIITDIEQLRGLELSGWAFVPSAGGLPFRQRRDLMEMAQLRLRGHPQNNCNKPLAMPN